MKHYFRNTPFDLGLEMAMHIKKHLSGYLTCQPSFLGEKYRPFFIILLDSFFPH